MHLNSKLVVVQQNQSLKKLGYLRPDAKHKLQLSVRWNDRKSVRVDTGRYLLSMIQSATNEQTNVDDKQLTKKLFHLLESDDKM